MDINTKRELRRFSEKYGKTLEPFFVILILAIFAIPILTVINLTPETRRQKSNNVLGVTDSSQLVINTVGGSHEVIQDEIVKTDEEGNKIYSATLKKHDKGVFSKPIFEITNSTDSTTTLKLIARTENSSSTKVGAIFSDVNYVLQGEDGQQFFHNVEIEPGQTQKVYLTIETPNAIAFDEIVNLNLIVQ